MGRIMTSVSVENLANSDQRIRCDALVDTGASHVELPSAPGGTVSGSWRSRTRSSRACAREPTGDQGRDLRSCKDTDRGFPCRIYEVLFLDMAPEDGIYEPLIGYIVLEHSAAALDMLGHRLVHVKRMDLN